MPTVDLAPLAVVTPSSPAERGAPWRALGQGEPPRTFRHSRRFGFCICAAGYLYGSIPLIYLLGRRKHVDLRLTGSGNVGATNLLASGQRSLSVLGWVFDASKGLVPVLVARRMGCPEDVAQMAGACGVAGQCWPVFLGMTGGRGISAFVGASLAMTDNVGWSLTLAPFVGGGLWRVLPRVLPRVLRRAGTGNLGAVRSKSVPFGCFLGVAAFPLLSAVRPRIRQRRLAYVPTLVSSVILLRRMTAPLPDDVIAGPEMNPMAVVYRLLYDRNTSA